MSGQGRLTAPPTEQNRSEEHFPPHDRIHPDALPCPIRKERLGNGADVDLEHDDAEDPDGADDDAEEADVGVATAEKRDAHDDRRQVSTEEGEECTKEMNPAEAKIIIVLTAVDHRNHHHSQGVGEGEGDEGQAPGSPRPTCRTQCSDSEEETVDDEGDVDDHMQWRVDGPTAQHLDIGHAKVTDVIHPIRIARECGGSDGLGEDIDHTGEDPADRRCGSRTPRCRATRWRLIHGANSRWCAGAVKRGDNALIRSTRPRRESAGACQVSIAVQI